MTTEIGHMGNEADNMIKSLDIYYSKGIFKDVGDINVSSNTSLFPPASRRDVYTCVGDGLIGGLNGMYVEDGDLLLCVSDSFGGRFEEAAYDFVLIRNNTLLALYDYKKGSDASNITEMDSVNSAISKLENLFDIHFKKFASETLGHFKGNENFHVDELGRVSLHGALNLPGHPTANDPSINDRKGMVTLGFLDEYLKSFSVEYGVRKAISSSSPTLERIVKIGSTVYYGTDTGLVSEVSTRSYKGNNSFDNIYPWRDITRCNMDKTGKILAYAGDPIYKEDGTNGNVMVEIPAFYSKYQHNPNNDGYDYYWICDTKIDTNYKLNPLFCQGGVYRDVCYISAFSIFMDSVNDNILSVGGKTTKVMTAISDVTTLITKIGTQYSKGFSLGTKAMMDILFYLFIIEFATFNSQSIMTGIETSHTSGIVSSILGSSGSNADPHAGEAFIYRGIESLWGNKGQVLQDIFPKQISGSTFDIYVSDNVSKYYNFATMPIPDATAIANGYKTLGTQLTSNLNGYATDFLPDNVGFCKIPTGNTGSSTTYLCDYANYKPDGLFVIGASIAFSSNRGINNLTTSTNSDSTSFGARLQYAMGVV